jgi:phospholipase C
LQKIENIVVLMLENRSFDHMLGYLKLESHRQDIDGLVPGLANSDGSSRYEIHHLSSTEFHDNQDPCHSGSCVAEQLADNNGGFVNNYVETHPGDPDRGLVMGYYNGLDLPVYDHLAAEFAVCDRWFSSVPGATWPNRLYALTGRANKSKDNPPHYPWYYLQSFVRHLDRGKIPWGWYSDGYYFGQHVITLRFADANYRWGGNFAEMADFYSQAAAGTLPSVCWIDPIFVDLANASTANDDHPPGDVRHGQEFALKIYHALARGPQWSKTLLVIVYDEHGGLYDHVALVAAEDNDPNFRSTGLRVPALVVSPWLPRQHAEHAVFDHASLVKTILLRFCRRADGSIPDMGKRVTAANHLGSLLTEPVPRQAPDTDTYQSAIDELARWRGDLLKDQLRPTAVRARRRREPTDFQEGLMKAAQRAAATKPRSRSPSK